MTYVTYMTYINHNYISCYISVNCNMEKLILSGICKTNQTFFKLPFYNNIKWILTKNFKWFSLIHKTSKYITYITYWLIQLIL